MPFTWLAVNELTLNHHDIDTYAYVVTHKVSGLWYVSLSSLAASPVTNPGQATACRSAGAQGHGHEGAAPPNPKSTVPGSPKGCLPFA